MKNPGILDFLEEKGFTAKELKSGISFSYQNIKTFTLNNLKFKDEIVIGDFNFNLFRGKTKVIEKIENIEGLDALPTLKNVDEKSLVKLLIKYKVIEAVVDITDFKETQSEYTLGEEIKEGKKLNYRSNLPTELQIVRMVFKGSEYCRPGKLVLGKNDVVLDLGGNIGCFSLDIQDKVKQVVTFEPEDVNFSFLKKNIEQNKVKNVVLHKAAVVGNEDKVRQLFLGRVPYYYSFLVKNNRKPVDVKCLNINDIIQKYDPTKIKADIEGAEWEVLTSIKDFKNINQVVFEYNFDMNGDLKNGFKKFGILRDHLRKHKFDVTILERDMKQNWNLVFCVNRKTK